MELTDEAIHDTITVVLDSFSRSVTHSMLRPSGLVRVAARNLLLPQEEEANSLKAAMALAMIRQATTADGDFTTRWIFLFLCGFVYENEGKLDGIFSHALDDFETEGFAPLTAHQIGVFKKELSSQILARAHGDEDKVADRKQLDAASWVIGKRVRKHVNDGEALEEIFEKEWLSDVQGE